MTHDLKAPWRLGTYNTLNDADGTQQFFTVEIYDNTDEASIIGFAVLEDVEETIEARIMEGSAELFLALKKLASSYESRQSFDQFRDAVETAKSLLYRIENGER